MHKILPLVFLVLSLNAFGAYPSKPKSMTSVIARLCEQLLEPKITVRTEPIDWQVEKATETDVEIYNTLLDSLLLVQAPDFVEFQAGAPYSSIRKAFYSEKFWETLKNKVTELSEGRMALEDVDPEQFPGRVRGAYRYLRLTYGSVFKSSVFVGIGPYNDPVQIFSHRRSFFSPWFEPTPKRSDGTRGFWDSWF